MTKPTLILSDTHFHKWSAFSSILPDGRNSRLVIIINSVRQAADHLRRQGGDTIYFAGDLFHVRGSVAPSVLNPVLDLFRELINDGFTIRIIPGNHDLESNDSDRLTNANQALASVGCQIANSTTYFEDDKVVMIPWHNKCADTLQIIRDAAAHVGDPEHWTVITHAPLNGVIKGIPDTGLDPQELSDTGFGAIFVGHYHNHKKFFHNVWSVGATTHQTWNDVDAKAGYVIKQDWDVEHYETDAPKFIDFDNDWEEEDAAVFCAGNYVRIKLDEASEGEIKAMREAAINDWKALGCSIIATPKRTAVTRTGSTVKSGATIRQSVKDWVDSNPEGVAADDLYAECEEILGGIGL